MFTKNKSIKSDVPIFIHSLWRSGSTYLFNVFRRSSFNYYCYKEPIHEEVLWKKDNPILLISDQYLETVKILSHPKLDKPYFQELYEVRENWKNKIIKSIIYDDSFGLVNAKQTKVYLESLILSAKGRPVIFECRTPYRISIIKTLLPGIHIYLYRNPWDSWWDYKANHYFDLANLLIINAPIHPPIIKKLRKTINFIEFHSDNIGEEFSYFHKYGRLSSENSYLVFYILWFIGLYNGFESSDFMINIDALSFNDKYRNDVVLILESKGICGLNFEDCRIPQNSYAQQDIKFFQDIEEKAINLLLDSGYKYTDIKKLAELREKYTPPYLRNCLNELPIDRLSSEITILRNLVRRLESEYAIINETQNELEADYKINEFVRIKRNYYGLTNKKSSNYDTPILLGSYKEFNIVHLSGIVYIIPQNLGELDISKEESRNKSGIIAIHDIDELNVVLAS